MKNRSCLFHQDGAEGEEGSSCPSQSQSRRKALNAKKAALKSHHSHTQMKEDPSITHVPAAKALPTDGSPNTIGRAALGGTSVTTLPSSSSPWPLRLQKIEDNNTCVHQIQQAVQKLCDNDGAKVSTRSDPTEGLCRLAPDEDHLDCVQLADPKYMLLHKREKNGEEKSGLSQVTLSLSSTKRSCSDSPSRC